MDIQERKKFCEKVSILSEFFTAGLSVVAFAFGALKARAAVEDSGQLK